MKNVRYLVRFDDICPTMNWEMWSRIEDILDKYNIKPIIAVTPNNKHPALIHSEPNKAFWSECRNWQKKHYEIALHGYDHIFINQDKGLLGYSKESEFAGVPIEIQDNKIKLGVNTFNENGIVVRTWVAPNHTFDNNTINILKKYGIYIISDGLWRNPFFNKEKEIFFVPQQLWRYVEKNSGVWTICYHHNKWTEKEFLDFKHDMKEIAQKQTKISDLIINVKNNVTVIDKITAKVEYVYKYQFKQLIFSLLK